MLLLASGSASAQESEADRHLRRGVELRRASDDEGAEREFRLAYELRAEPRTAAQWGLALQALGRWLEARARIAEALQARGDSWVTRNRAALEQARTAIEGRLGRVEVRCSTPGAVLLIEGREVGGFPRREPDWVRAGSVAIEVRAGGYTTVTRTLRVEAGELTREPVEMVAVVVATPPSGSEGGSRPGGVEAVDEGRTQRRTGWILTGVGAGFGVVGVVGTVLVYGFGQGGFLSGGCLSTTCGERAGYYAGFALGVGGFVLGAAGLGVGIALITTARPPVPSRVAFGCLPRVGDVVCGGVW